MSAENNTIIDIAIHIQIMQKTVNMVHMDQ